MIGPIPLERSIQASIAQAMELGLPFDCLFTAIPAGDKHAVTTPGYRNGIPDLLFQYRGKSLWVELKRPKYGVVSVAQRECHQLIERAGCLVHMARSLTEVVDLVRVELQCPLRLKVT
jgi:hypothetical protein